MRWIWKLLKFLLLGLLILIGGGLLVMYVADPTLTTRLVGTPFGVEAGPASPVAAGPEIPLPIARPDLRTIEPAALEAAVELGARMDSHALLVWHRGALQLEYYYPGFGPDTRTPTQSMHKSVLAMLVGIAIEQGHIESVDDPASRYLTEWANDARAAITIRQMLQQSSGIGFPTVGFNPLGGFFQLVLGADIAPIVLGQPMDGEPGARFDYNSINPQALGILIERVTGMKYAEYLSTALWQKLGAPPAAVVLDSERTGMARTFCCLNAPAQAWLRVGLLHIDEGRVGDTQVVPADWMQAIATPAPANPNYGFLTWLGNEYEEYRYYNRKTSVNVYQSEPFAAPDVIYFDGFGGQRVYAVPSLQLVIVRTGAMAPGWDEAELPNLIIRGIKKPGPRGGGPGPLG
jgi:CubicO group peptidase (beta-lactamase class C family)